MRDSGFFLSRLTILFHMNKIPLCSSFSSLFAIFSLLFRMPIDSEIMDGFWYSRCLNYHIDLLYMIGSFASGTNVSLVAKNGTKKNIPLLSIKSSPVDRIQSLRCLNDCINLPNMIESFASGANVSLVAKMELKKIFHYCQ